MNNQEKNILYLIPNDVLKLRDRFGNITYLACYAISHENLIGVLELEKIDTFCGKVFEVASVGSSYFISRNTMQYTPYIGKREIVAVYRIFHDVSLNDFFADGEIDLRKADVLYEKE